MKRTIVSLSIAVFVCGAFAQTTAPQTRPAEKVLESIRAAQDHEISADPNDGFWKQMPAIHVTRSVMGQELAGRHLNAEVRSRWTADTLYMLYICDYEQLTVNDKPNLKEETQRLWLKDVIELYIGTSDPGTPATRYRELQMSPQGEFIDNDIDATVRRPGFNGEDKWNSGFTVKAVIDKEKKQWIGEMKIPLKAIEVAGRLPVKAGQEFRLNVYKQDGSGGGGPNSPNGRTFMAWQPPGVWNPHHPEVFGVLRLSDHAKPN
jgi:hypothetical protein